MSKSGVRDPLHFINTRTNDPRVQPIGQWPFVNQNFYVGFKKWLLKSGYSPSALEIYGIAARYALGFLQKPYWQLDPETDRSFVRDHLQERLSKAATLSAYAKGLAKFGEYVRLHSPPPGETQRNSLGNLCGRPFSGDTDAGARVHSLSPVRLAVGTAI